MMFCLQEAVNNTFENNLSVDDWSGTMTPASNPDAYVANNTFYVRHGVPFVRKRMHGKMTVKDNKIIKIEKKCPEVQNQYGKKQRQSNNPYRYGCC